MQVAILKKLKAENVVRFLGVCADKDETMLVSKPSWQILRHALICHELTGGTAGQACQSGAPQLHACVYDKELLLF